MSRPSFLFYYADKAQLARGHFSQRTHVVDYRIIRVAVNPQFYRRGFPAFPAMVFAGSYTP